MAIMKKKIKEIAELGKAFHGIMNCDIHFQKKEELLLTLLFAHCGIDNDADRNKFASWVLNLKEIK
jgi:hypothetical protein